MYYLAEKLGKTFNEVADISVDEFLEWKAYFKIQNQEQKRTTSKAANAPKLPRRRR